MTANWRLGPVARLVGIAVLFVVSSGPAQARDHARTTVCTAAQYASQPGTATQPQMMVYSVLSLVNPNADEPIFILALSVFDRNGRELCAYSQANPLPVKAFDPSRPFDFTEPLGPNQTLNVMTARLPCVTWPIVTTANAADLMGTLTIRVTWAPARGERWVTPILGGVGVIYADIATGRTDATRSLQCTEAWP